MIPADRWKNKHKTAKRKRLCPWQSNFTCAYWILPQERLVAVSAFAALPGSGFLSRVLRSFAVTSSRAASALFAFIISARSAVIDCVFWCCCEFGLPQRDWAPLVFHIMLTHAPVHTKKHRSIIESFIRFIIHARAPTAFDPSQMCRTRLSMPHFQLL